MKKYFVPLKFLKPIEEVQNKLTEYTVQLCDDTSNNKKPFVELFKNKDKYYIIHYKEKFTSFGFFVLNRIEKQKVKMSNLEFLMRDNIINALIKDGYVVKTKRT